MKEITWKKNENKETNSRKKRSIIKIPTIEYQYRRYESRREKKGNRDDKTKK